MILLQSEDTPTLYMQLKKKKQYNMSDLAPNIQMSGP